MWLRIKCFVWSPTARIRLSTEWLRAGAKKNFSHVLLFLRKYFNLEPCLFSVWRHIFSTHSNKPNHANIYMFLLCSVRPFLSLNQYVNTIIRVGRSFFYVSFLFTLPYGYFWAVLEDCPCAKCSRKISEHGRRLASSKLKNVQMTEMITITQKSPRRKQETSTLLLHFN